MPFHGRVRLHPSSDTARGAWPCCGTRSRGQPSRARASGRQHGWLKEPQATVGSRVKSPAVLDYHRDVPARRPVFAVRLQGRPVSLALPTNITGGNVSPRRLATVIKTLREQRDMTQEELAKKAGVTQGYIAQLENGLRKNPSLPA